MYLKVSFAKHGKVSKPWKFLLIIMKQMKLLKNLF